MLFKSGLSCGTCEVQPALLISVSGGGGGWGGRGVFSNGHFSRCFSLSTVRHELKEATLLSMASLILSGIKNVSFTIKMEIIVMQFWHSELCRYRLVVHDDVECF